MDSVAEGFKERTKRFALAILDFSESLPSSSAADALRKQLLRAGFGVAGNYRGACRSRSHAEFTARLGVVLEEVDEAELWLDILSERALGDDAVRGRLLDESRQLRAIFAKAYNTSKSRDRRKKIE